jgi:hypothetical protein
VLCLFLRGQFESFPLRSRYVLGAKEHHIPAAWPPYRNISLLQAELIEWWPYLNHSREDCEELDNVVLVAGE